MSKGDEIGAPDRALQDQFYNQIAPLIAKCYQNPLLQDVLIRRLASLSENDYDFARRLHDEVLRPNKNQTSENEKEDVIEAIKIWHESACEEARLTGNPEPTQQEVEQRFVEEWMNKANMKKTLENWRTEYNKKYKDSK